ncbi:MAG TPA: Flp pilus assembly protein CpaB [Reyranella sp.]|jgi:pilus assembly protein CpaB|nr:Flp pilus assembly protein CpaB [Reyranella sp.]
MNSKRVIFLLLAVIVAGATAFLARAWLQSEREALIAQAGLHRTSPSAPTLQVLVAKQNIRVGQLIKPDTLRWQAWPAGNLSPSYIVEGKHKEQEFVGAVVRSSIAVGEPITDAKIVLANSRGFMAAVLQPGMRAVSIPVSATSAVSGFIYAGDRVDVLLTHVLNSPSGNHSATETILRNARVIAMDQRVDFSPGDKPDVAKTATLELTPKQSEIVTLALKMGDLSLVLRSLQHTGEEEQEAATDNGAAEPGDSFTQDSQVSHLISSAPPTPEPPKTVLVLRGSTTAKQDIDGAGGRPGDSDTKPAENRPNTRTVTFTRTTPNGTQ